MKDNQPPARTKTAWAVYQWGRLWSVERTRREAIKEALYSSGESWKKTQAYFRVVKVTVTPVNGRGEKRE